MAYEIDKYITEYMRKRPSMKQDCRKIERFLEDAAKDLWEVRESHSHNPAFTNEESPSILFKG
jgi:hypothetical protein